MARKCKTPDSREDANILRVRRDYVQGNITLDEFEKRVEAILRGEDDATTAPQIPILGGQRAYR